MDEYINKKELIDFIKDTRQRLSHDSKDFFTRDNMLLNFEQIASQMPTADVVEVVRCKDCGHWHGIGFAENAGWCEKKECGTLYNDFCSYGERKDT